MYIKMLQHHHHIYQIRNAHRPIGNILLIKNNAIFDNSVLPILIRFMICTFLLIIFLLNAKKKRITRKTVECFVCS